MAKNCVQAPTQVVPLTAPANLTSGQVVKVGDFIGVALTDIASGVKGSVALDGIWTVPKVAGAITAGQRLLWNAASAAMTGTVTTTHTHAGAALEAAGTDATEVTIVLGYPPKAAFTA